MGTRKDLIQLSESLCSDDGYQRCIDYAEQEPDLFWSAMRITNGETIIEIT